MASFLNRRACQGCTVRTSGARQSVMISQKERTAFNDQTNFFFCSLTERERTIMWKKIGLVILIAFVGIIMAGALEIINQPRAKSPLEYFTIEQPRDVSQPGAGSAL